MENKGVMIAILLVLSPILFTMAIYPDSFSLSWNQGRGGFLFAAAFIAAELIGLKFVIPKKRFFYCIPLIALTITYFISLQFGVRDYIMSLVDVFYLYFENL